MALPSSTFNRMKKLYIRKSKIAGRGIIAAEDIRKGEYIWPLIGTLHTRHYKKPSDYKNEQTWIPVAVHKWINPKFPFKHLNHSCEPSAGFRTPRKVYALRDIKTGEEITVDYSTIEYVHFWKIHCSCGARKCRKIIRSVHFLPAKFYRSYLPYIPTFIRNAYRHRKIALK